MLIHDGVCLVFRWKPFCIHHLPRLLPHYPLVIIASETSKYSTLWDVLRRCWHIPIFRAIDKNMTRAPFSTLPAMFTMPEFCTSNPNWHYNSDRSGAYVICRAYNKRDLLPGCPPVRLNAYFLVWICCFTSRILLLHLLFFLSTKTHLLNNFIIFQPFIAPTWRSRETSRCLIYEETRCK